MKKHIILISGNTLKQEETLINSLTKNYYQTAANTFSNSIFSGLKEAFNGQLSLISAPLIPSYPLNFKRLIYKGTSNFKYFNKNAYGTNFITLPLLKLLNKQISIYNVLTRRIYKETEEYIIIIYGTHTPYIYSAVKFKKKYPNTKLCLIVPDLPQYMSANMNPLYCWLKNIDQSIQKKLYKHIDSFVFLTNYMPSYFNICAQPYIIIEGIANPELYVEKYTHLTDVEKKNIILYTGTLDKRYGLEDLLLAFEKINNAELWICGEGDLKYTIETMIKRGLNIKYFGQISHEQSLILQKQARILVNPRSSKGEYTKYSFPSKTIEYLASGTPCIMRHLPGIPKEYDDYLFYTKDDSIDALRNAIVSLMSKPQHELNLIGQKASNFILREKNYRIQGEKILKMILQ